MFWVLSFTPSRETQSASPTNCSSRWSITRQTSPNGMVTGPVAIPLTTEITSSPSRIRLESRTCSLTQRQTCFIAPDQKQSGWNAWANFSMVSPVMELAKTSHSFTEMMRSF